MGTRRSQGLLLRLSILLLAPKGAGEDIRQVVPENPSAHRVLGFSFHHCLDLSLMEALILRRAELFYNLDRTRRVLSFLRLKTMSIFP